MSARFLLAALFVTTPAFADDLVSVGVARTDITPKYSVRLSGYGGRRAESDGIAQSIWAKALAIGDNPNATIIVTVDNLGIPDEMTTELARRLKEKHGIARERLAVCASHTHSAPMLTNVAPTLFGVPIPAEHQQNIDRYTRELADKLEQVAVAALADRKPARLTWARGKVPFAANRRTSGGPVDHDLPVLRVTDPDGKLRAVLVNYACHCTTLGGEFNRLHGDWAGTAQELLERSHPGAVALIAIGCGADANPQPRGTLNLALQHGEQIALEVARLLRGEWKQLGGVSAAKLDYVELPFDKLPTRAEWQARARQADAIGHHARVQLAKLDAGQQLPTKLRYPIQTLTFSDRLAMVFLAGEVVVDYSLRLKKEYDPERMWVNAYSNDAPCYIPSVRILQEGGYEGGGAMIYYDRPTRFAPQVEEIIFSALRKQLPPAFKAAKDPQEFPPPKEPKESQSCLKLSPGFHAVLAASEPLVQSPVAIDWGIDGKLWVVEMFDYPTGVDRNYKPGGRVKYLVDDNNDGVYDKAVTLADDLPFPTGVMAWKKGVLVCSAPEIVYLEDTNGDGKADVRRVLFSGFATENYQARVNSLTYSLDGWIYAANGLLGGNITSHVGAKKTVNIGGRDLRFNPDTGEIEPVTGLSQQGLARDDWGNWFGCDNSNLIWHFPLPDHYLRRNPNFQPPPSRVYVPTGDADPNRLFPAGRVLKRFNDLGHVGRVTSACSVTIFRDTSFGPEYAGNAFTCEPVHNLVTRRVLTPKGSTFVGKRAAGEQDREFLASTDNWFRPVQVRTGPDGALWVVDMYRFVIEHPRWITPDRLAELDVRAGAERGRIYRIVPKGAPPYRPTALAGLNNDDLTRQLMNPNGVVRDMAQQLLVARRDPATAPMLKMQATSASAAGQVHSLNALELIGQLDTRTLLNAIASRSPQTRIHAVRLSESRLAASPELNAAVTRLADDDNAQVRFQVALSLGQSREPKAGMVLARMLLRDRADPYLVAAILSSVNGHNLTALLENLIAGGSPADSALFARVLALAPAVAPEKCPDLLAALSRPVNSTHAAWQLESAAALLDAMERRAPTSTANEKLMATLAPLSALARSSAESPSARESERIAAVRLLARFDSGREADIQRLGRLIDSRQSPSLRHAAIERLAQSGHGDAPAALLAGWAVQTADTRSRVLDALLAREAWANSLLSAIETGRVRAGDLDASRRQTLMTHRNAELRRRAALVLKSTSDPDRRKAVDAYAAVRTMKGDAKAGAAVFVKTCAACHKIGDVGNATGPDLAALTDRTTDGLLIAILDPNRALDGRYAAFNALTKRGQQFSGMLRSESAAAITLVAADGKTHDILRSDLDELTNSGKSLMPEGMEKDISPPAMADLIAYLQSLGKPPKKVPGNTPAVVNAAANGGFRLTAASCEIHGDQVTFESEFRNIGMWHGSSDHIAWTLTGAKPGKYRIEMTYACDDSSAGNMMSVQVGSDVVSMRVAGTGGWSNYVETRIGEVNLSDAPSRVVVRPGGPIRGALIDLKELRLVPVK